MMTWGAKLVGGLAVSAFRGLMPSALMPSALMPSALMPSALMPSALILCLTGLNACNRAEPEKKLEQTGQVAGQKMDSPSDRLPSQLENPDSAAAGPISGLASAMPMQAGAVVSPSQGVVGASATESSPAAANTLGLTIETVPSLPSEGVPIEPVVPERLADRSFMKLNLPETTTRAAEVLAFLASADRAVQELTITRQSGQMSEQEFLTQAKRISTLKLQAGQRLQAAADATPAQQKTAIGAQVESLSQLTGLGDVEAARTLQKLADQLAESSDTQLSHQGKLVRLGFRLNQLQEGQVKDPQVISEDIDQVLSAPDRGLVEFLALQQSVAVLAQLGYTEQATGIEQRLVREYTSSSDRELAMRAWSIEVNNSPQLIAYHQACQDLFSGVSSDANRVGITAAELFKRFPSINTLSYFLRMIVDLEYNGKVEAARQLAGVVAREKSQFLTSSLIADIEMVLDGHNRRLDLIGKPIQLDELIGFDNAAFDWALYRNKVVLVAFWASWDVPSLNLLSEMKNLRTQITGPGFEIVGIALDDQLTMSSAERIVLSPSTVGRQLRSSNPAAAGMNTTVARSLGVNAMPMFAMLVDKAGIVRAVHPPLERLPEMIAELMK